MALLLLSPDEQEAISSFLEEINEKYGEDFLEVFTVPAKINGPKTGELVGELQSIQDEMETLKEKVQLRTNALFNSVKYMRTVLDLQVSYVFILRQDEIIDANQRFLNAFNFSTQEEIQEHIIEALAINSGKKTPAPELLRADNWVKYILSHQDAHFRLQLDYEDTIYHFDVSARGMLYQSGVSDEDYQRYNFVVVTMNEVSDILREIDKNREKDYLLIQQSKFAAMGEMIGNIAHQWRQPLNSLAVISQNLKYRFMKEKLTLEALEETIKKQMELIKNMSTTIDDFRNFLKPDISKETFDMNQAIKTSLSLVEASLQENGITCKTQINIPDSCPIRGSMNEFNQCLINLIHNAREAFISNNIDERHIILQIQKMDSDISITVEDNAGGIPEYILEKIFDPYFTTKGEHGTGIGLYMSQMIIQQKFKGTIQAENTHNGALFTVAVPVAI